MINIKLHTSIREKYNEALATVPERGAGLHRHLPKIANYGIMLGFTDEMIESDTNKNCKGIRKKEAIEAIRFARRDVTPIDFEKKSEYTRPAIPTPKTYKPEYVKPLEKFIEGAETDMMELIEMSPVRLLCDQERDGYAFLECVYNKDEYLFIGDTYSKEVKTTGEWLKTDLQKYPFFIPNPMTGQEHETTMGVKSYRCEKSVKDCRFAVVEMDDIPMCSQIAFWCAMIQKGYPVASVVHSGKKSLHGLLKVSCEHNKWQPEVKEKLFDNFLIHMGADVACKNKARLSRFPGHQRDGAEMQRILYLKG